MKTFEYTIKDQLGIHARPAGLLVKTAKAAGCAVTIEKEGKKADAAKLFNVMGLGVKFGDTVTISCEGENEDEALLQMKAFFDENL